MPFTLALKQIEFARSYTLSLLAEIADDEWFTMTIRVEGKHVVTSVNGKVITDWTEPEGFEPPKIDYIIYLRETKYV